VVSDKPIRVAIIGLGFGAEFIPICQNFPGAELHAICRRDRKGLDESGDRYGVKIRYTDYRKLLEDPNIDAVHINSPISDHAWMAIEGLRAGKHVACTVPMGTSIDECRQIVLAQRKSGCPKGSAASRNRRPFRTPSICRSCREAATAARTRTWSTPSYYPGKKDHHKRVTTEQPHPTGGSCPREGHGKGKLIRILFSVYFGGFRG